MEDLNFRLKPFNCGTGLRQQEEEHVSILQYSTVSYIIPEGVLLRSVPCVRCHEFYIQLALPISPEIMDGF